MSLKLTNTWNCPPGGFRGYVTETNTRIPSEGSMFTYPDWIAAMRKHHLANNLPMPLNFEEVYQEQLCKELPPGWCDRDGIPYTQGSGGRLSFGIIKQGTLTLLDWWRKGRKKVSLQEANERAVICSSCPRNKELDCASCSLGLLQSIVNLIVQGQPTSYDNHLKGCEVCGCSLKAKVWLDLEVLQNHIPESQNALYPDFCWLKKQS